MVGRSTGWCTLTAWPLSLPFVLSRGRLSPEYWRVLEPAQPTPKAGHMMLLLTRGSRWRPTRLLEPSFEQELVHLESLERRFSRTPKLLRHIGADICHSSRRTIFPVNVGAAVMNLLGLRLSPRLSGCTIVVVLYHKYNVRV